MKHDTRKSIDQLLETGQPELALKYKWLSVAERSITFDRFGRESIDFQQMLVWWNRPVAVFIGAQKTLGNEKILLYNIIGGPRHGSTVARETLEQLNIEVPRGE